MGVLISLVILILILSFFISTKHNTTVSSTACIYRNKKNGVLFEEVTRYDKESVMFRTEINTRLLIQHVELEKYYEKCIDKKL